MDIRANSNMNASNRPTLRYWEVDAARGIALLLMVVYHLFFDLMFFGAYGENVAGGWWQVFQRFIGVSFVGLAGLSLTLSYTKAVERSQDGRGLFGKFLRRGLFVFGWGLAITAVTLIALPQGAVIFGVLHLIGFSIIAAYPFIRRKWLSFAVGSFLVIIGAVLLQFRFQTPWLLWLGFMPEQFYTLDYFPVLPWFGVALLGVFLGNWLYPQRKRRFSLPDLSGFLPVRLLSFLGRHSLLIYLVHQPVIIGMLILLGVADVRQLL